MLILYFITARKRSCGKVMFLHVSVILFTGGCLVPGGLLLGGACSGEWGCLVPGGGVPGPRGVPAPGGVLGGTPPQTAFAAGGTHPTGMHSCCLRIWSIMASFTAVAQ